jgi:hypothetical protein
MNQSQGSMFSFHMYEGLRKGLFLKNGSIGQFCITGNTVFHPHHYIGHIFTLYFWIYQGGLTIKGMGFTK